MNAKHRLTVIFAMLSLTVLMLFFQNCSPTGEGLGFDSSVTDGFITNPPEVFTSKASDCVTPSYNFKVSEPLYVCIKNAGIAPKFCVAYSGGANCNYNTITTAAAWSNFSAGSWVKVFSSQTYNAFSPGNYTVYVVHTDDPSSFGQSNVTVSP